MNDTPDDTAEPDLQQTIEIPLWVLKTLTWPMFRPQPGRGCCNRCRKRWGR